ncbi:MAG: ABC transporter permease [Spirochaetota bacterium]
MGGLFKRPPWFGLRTHSPIGLYLGLLVTVIILIIALPQFRGARNLSSILLRSVPLLAVSAGQTFVLLGAGIDLSVGAVLSLSTAVASVAMSKSMVMGICLTIAAGMTVGLFNGVGVTKLRINPFLMTLGTTVITNGAALYIRPYPGGQIPIEYVNFMMKKTGVFPITPFVIFVSIAAMGMVVLRKSRYGRHLYAVGGNADAAGLAGINTHAVLMGTYVISGFFASLAGLYMTARICCGDPAVGTPFQMDSITGAVLGGTALTGGRGGIEGTVIGIIILTMLGNIFNLVNIDIYWQQVLRGLILIFVVGFSQLRARRREAEAALLTEGG